MLGHEAYLSADLSCCMLARFASIGIRAQKTQTRSCSSLHVHWNPGYQRWGPLFEKRKKIKKRLSRSWLVLQSLTVEEKKRKRVISIRAVAPIGAPVDDCQRYESFSIRVSTSPVADSFQLISVLVYYYKTSPSSKLFFFFLCFTKFQSPSYNRDSTKISVEFEALEIFTEINPIKF